MGKEVDKKRERQEIEAGQAETKKTPPFSAGVHMLRIYMDCPT